MIFVIINFLFNGIALGLIYIFGDAIIHLDAKNYHTPENTLLLMGFITSGLLTVIGISKIGHYILHFFLGGRNAIGREQAKLIPLLNEVITTVNNKKNTNYTPTNIRIKIKDIKEPNAQAFGKDTIIITDGLLKTANDEELTAVLAHELGHLYYKDSVILSATICGSIATKILVWLYGIYVIITTALATITTKITFLKETAPLAIVFAIFPIIIFLPIIAFNWLGLRILNLCLLFMSRHYEYRADKFAKEMGYQTGLISFLEKVQETTEHDKGMLGKIFASHPAPMKRIGRLEDNN
jgi:Zn-dependent protease with chaperone function